MLKVYKIVLLSLVLAITASCSAKHEETEPKGITYKAAEVLVRQCQDINDFEFQQLLTKHEVTIKKQMSPHLYTVTWKDTDRSAGEVVQELKNTTMFCGVDRYQEPAQ